MFYSDVLHVRRSQSLLTEVVSTGRSESRRRFQRQLQNQKILIRWSVFPCFTKPGARLPTTDFLPGMD